MCNYALIEKDFTKAAHITVKKVWFFTRRMYVTGKYFYKKYLDTNLKINVDTVHVTYKKHKTNFHAMCINKSLRN